MSERLVRLDTNGEYVIEYDLQVCLSKLYQYEQLGTPQDFSSLMNVYSASFFPSARQQDEKLRRGGW